MIWPNKCGNVAMALYILTKTVSKTSSLTCLFLSTPSYVLEKIWSNTGFWTFSLIMAWTKSTMPLYERSLERAISSSLVNIALFNIYLITRASGVGGNLLIVLTSAFPFCSSARTASWTLFTSAFLTLFHNKARGLTTLFINVLRLI